VNQVYASPPDETQLYSLENPYKPYDPRLRPLTAIERPHYTPEGTNPLSL